MICCLLYKLKATLLSLEVYLHLGLIRLVLVGNDVTIIITCPWGLGKSDSCFHLAVFLLFHKMLKSCIRFKWKYWLYCNIFYFIQHFIVSDYDGSKNLITLTLVRIIWSKCEQVSQLFSLFKSCGCWCRPRVEHVTEQKWWPGKGF